MKRRTATPHLVRRLILLRFAAENITQHIDEHQAHFKRRMSKHV
jgi:hypothetical protein